MDATKASATADAAQGAEAEEPAPGDRERARARAYLDLWERQVVHVALYGPASEPEPESAPAPGRTSAR